MPDTTDTKGTVDGVEPSILVKFVENASLQDTTSVIQLFPFDNGALRTITLGGNPVLVTQKDLAAVTGGHRLEVVEDDADTFVVNSPQPIPSEPQRAPQNIQPSIPTPLPGQSGS